MADMSADRRPHLAKKDDKAPRAKPQPAKAEAGERWTVRGVPVRLQKAAAEAAWAADLTMGGWLSRLVEEAVAGSLPPSEPSTVERLASIERRLALLEKRVPQPFRLHAHHWLILHGRYTCKARVPECWRCPVVDLCEFRNKVLEPPVAGGKRVQSRRRAS